MSYCDLQVNGYGGVDFNRDDLDAESLHRACERLATDGVGAILATVITDDVERMCLRLRRIADLRQCDELAQRTIAGVHIEGPFISPRDGYRGAHPRDAVILADVGTMSKLLDAAGGLARIVTLAPECDAQFRVTRMLAAREILVAAGHTDATIDQLRGALDAGLSMFTHLGNGCPMTVHRHDNMVQRALSLRERFRWISFIADGVHLPLFALRNYLELAGTDRALVVSDAIAPARLGPGRYTLGRWDLSVGEDLVARAPDGSHLIGSAATLRACHRRLREQAGLSEQTCRALLCDNPRRALQLAQ